MYVVTSQNKSGVWVSHEAVLYVTHVLHDLKFCMPKSPGVR